MSTVEQIMPNLAKQLVAMQGFDCTKFGDYLRKLLPYALMIYWQERQNRCKALATWDAHMRSALDRDNHPNLWIEDKLCEVGRRRAAALAFAAAVITRLPKGRLKLATILSSEAIAKRTLSDLYILIRVGTRVTFEKLTNVMSAYATLPN